MAGEKEINLDLDEPNLGDFAALENIYLLKKGVTESIEPPPDTNEDSDDDNIFDFESEDLKIEFDFSAFNKR